MLWFIVLATKILSSTDPTHYFVFILYFLTPSFSLYLLIFHTTVSFFFISSVRLKFPTFPSLPSHFFYSTKFSFRNLLFDEFSFCICAYVIPPYLIKQNVYFYFFHTNIFLLLRVWGLSFCSTRLSNDSHFKHFSVLTVSHFSVCLFRNMQTCSLTYLQLLFYFILAVDFLSLQEWNSTTKQQDTSNSADFYVFSYAFIFTCHSLFNVWAFLLFPWYKLKNGCSFFIKKIKNLIYVTFSNYMFHFVVFCSRVWPVNNSWVFQILHVQMSSNTFPVWKTFPSVIKENVK